MKRLMLGMIAATLLLFTSAEPARSQGPYGGRGAMCWRQNVGFGQRGVGMRNGTGPRAQNGTCPWLNVNPAAAPNTVAPYGMGMRNGTGPRGQNGTCPLLSANPANAPNAVVPYGMGMRNGTGPRAQNGTCPLLTPSIKAPAPATPPATSK